MTTSSADIKQTQWQYHKDSKHFKYINTMKRSVLPDKRWRWEGGVRQDAFNDKLQFKSSCYK